MCEVKNEQRIVIKFLVKSGEKPAEIFRKLQRVFGNDCLSNPRVYEWVTRFASDRETTQDDARSGAPKVVYTRQNVERLRVLVRTDRRLTIQMMSNELGINKETICQMLHNDLLMHFHERIQSEGHDWMNSIITTDESWVYQYDPETRRQSKQWVEDGGECPTKAGWQETKSRQCSSVSSIKREHNNAPPPPYSPDLAPLDFWLFPKKEPMKGHRYKDLEDIKRFITSVLKNLTSGDFQGCFQKWRECWTKCVRLGGEYCEGMGA
ncbi:Winged helix-turn-helix DNA-binding domain [Cinara cedri]|uniref:Winged helix-turn-helix DNA-binding domain n=1 Tax=Cinara cedri TaxID=506608 RepID=A0A5E4MCA0_9HEMI|nr:Winged helix-turn-helix DNA-binding domain [Cinara cedri]